LRSISSSKLLGGSGSKDGDYRSKVAMALKQIEVQRRELEGVRGRLTERRKSLFDSTVKALQEKNNPKANVYAIEHAEVCKTMKVVEASELALTQITLRLESIMEVGDVMSHLTTAFKSLKMVSKEMETFGPQLDATSSSINSTLAETMAHMGQISPSLNIDIRTENAEELVEAARKFAQEQGQKLNEGLKNVPIVFEGQVGEAVEDRLSILTTGDDYEEEESPILGTIFKPSSDPRIEQELLKYAAAHDGVVDATETSTSLGIPQEAVEHSMIRLVAQGKVKSQKSETSR
jgi:division protein CdvB (Snf7/Vps24/ESCRT-III family)